MSELTLSVIIGAIALTIALIAVMLIAWLETRPYSPGNKEIRNSVWAHFLWCGIVFPFTLTAVAFPIVAAANLIWKFIP